MIRKLAWAAGVSAIALGLVVATTMMSSPVSQAADHADPPTRTGTDQAADIADFYAWHRGTAGSETIVVAVTLSGAAAAAVDQAGNFDRDVIVGIHFSNTGSGGTPAYADTHTIWVRFAQDSLDDWGIQVTNFPGETTPMEGAVGETITTPSGGEIWAGLADDPFFFDLEGFTDFTTTGDVASFNSLGGTPPAPRDSIAGTNATVVVLEFPASEVVNTGGMVHAWASTKRFP